LIGTQATFGEKLSGIEYVDRPAAYAVILDGEGRVAVVRGKRGWFLPGGGTDLGETPEDTIQREAREEIARELTLGQCLGEATQYFSVGDEHRRLEATFYLASLGAPTEGEAEYELEWVSLDEGRADFFHACHVWAVELAVAANPSMETIE
jgi:8-oxo-dGTP diphosphatase